MGWAGRSPGRSAGRVAGAVLAAVWLAAAAGCGFRPIYGGPAAGSPPSSSPTGTGTAAPSDPAAPSSPESSVIRDLAAVDVARIPDRPGQELRNALNDRLNPARLSEPSRFNLNIDLKQTVRQLAIDRAGLATRGNLTMTARYSLTDVTTGRVVFASSARSFVGYDILAGQSTSYFSTLTSTQDARSRAIDQLANQIRARLGAFFDTHPGGTVVGAPLEVHRPDLHHCTSPARTSSLARNSAPRVLMFWRKAGVS